MEMSINDNLDWNVISRDLSYMVDGNTYYVPGKVAQLRDDTNQIIGITSPSYQVYQNSDLKAFVEPMVEEGLLEIANIGTLKGGSRVYIQAQMAESFTVAGEQHRGLITLLNSHDGSAALMAGVTAHRVICSNTFRLVMGDMSTKLRHTQGLHDKAQSISAITEFVNENMRMYAQAASTLASTSCSDGTLDLLISAAYKKPVVNVRGANNIRQLFRSGKGNSGATLWDAVQGITDYTSHGAIKDSTKRFESVEFGRNANVNTRAFNSALALV